jgi:hypothetical protein
MTGGFSGKSWEIGEVSGQKTSPTQVAHSAGTSVIMRGGANAPGGEGVAERRGGGVNDSLWSATSTEDVAGDFVSPFPGGGDDADHHPLYLANQRGILVPSFVV